MATNDIGYRNAAARGTPAFEVLDAYVDSNLVCTAEPPMLKTNRILLASSTTLAPFSVVGLDANKNLVLATSGGVTPIGVLLHAAASGATNTTVFGEVTLGGDFNIGSDDAGTGSPLVWDASFNTMAKKLAAVIGNPNLRFGRRRLPA